MARSLLARRQEAERARLEAYDISLRRGARQPRPAPDFHNALDEARRGLEAHVLRDPLSWRPHMKTRDAARLRLAAARHLFARYPVAEHLEQIWIDATGLDADEIALRKRWYVVAAGGGSLYKAGAGAWLSRKEVHAFLNPPGALGFAEALWLAVASSYAADAGTALRIARTRIAETPRVEVGFWREVVRFFCAHPTTVEEMNDLRDFLAHCRAQDAAFSLKGRTLASLRRQMRAWHRDLEAIARIEAARRRAELALARARGQTMAVDTSAGVAWAGAAIADWSWAPSSKERGHGPARRETFVVTQLRTAADLVAETRAMHHCVVTYATKCIAGHASIWSVRHRVGSTTSRLLTIELDRQHRAVQVRGFANRLMLPEERKLLERWAKARGIILL